MRVRERVVLTVADMFTRVNADLGQRIKTATEALVAQTPVSKIASKAAAMSINDNQHNTGMFAHKQRNWTGKN